MFTFPSRARARRRHLRVVLLATAGALILPGVARAAGPQAYCVAGPASPPCPASFAANHTFATVSLAAAKVKSDGMAAITGDTVMVEPGTYGEPVVLQGQTGVTLFGDPAHAERPLITWDGAGGDTTFVATATGGLTMRHLELRATEAAGTRAALFSDAALSLDDVHLASTGEALEVDNHDTSITNVVADSLPGGTYPLVNLQGQEASTVHTIHDLTVNAADRSTGLALIGHEATVDGLSVTSAAMASAAGAPFPASAVLAIAPGSLTLAHVRAAGGSFGLFFLGGLSGSGELTLRDSLVTSAGPKSDDLITTTLGAGPATIGVAAGTATLTNVTAIASSADSVGVSAAPGYAGPPALPAAKVTITNSIVRGGAQDLRQLPSGGMLTPAASITADHTNYRPAAGDGVVAGPGNQSGDPLFAGAGDFHVQAGSPTLQAGVAVPGGTTDLEGHARPDPAGTAPDLGAYESAALLPGPPPPPVVKQSPPPALDRTAPVLSHLSLTNRTFKVGRTPTAVKARAALRAARRAPAKSSTIVRFTLSERASVSLRISRVTAGKRKKGSRRAPQPILRTVGTLLRANGRLGTNLVAFSGRIGKRRLAAGNYRIAVVATDAAANRSQERTVTFKIVAR